MNLLEVGGLLKRERERRRLSLRDVMEATKISRRNLNALEAGDVGHLPHPVYLKGYVRNYARLVGLDPEALVAVVDQQSDDDSGYLPQTVPTIPADTDAPAPSPEPAAADVALAEAAPAVAEPVQTAPADSEPAQPVPAPEQTESFASQIRFPRSGEVMSRPRRRLWPWIALAVVAVILAVLYLQYLRLQAAIDEALPRVVEVTPLVENATNATAEANATEPEANATLSMPEPAPASEPTHLPAPAPAVPASKPAPMTGPATSLPPVPASKPATPAVAAPSIEVTRKAPTAAQSPEPRTPGMQELVVTAKPGEVCWVEVSEGQMRRSFTLKDGESRRVEFSSKAHVRLGNAGGVSFQLNGAAYPFDGERGHTATVEIGAR